jgi:FkbH-like protein
MPVAVAGPTLPLPPLGSTIAAQASLVELELQALAAAFRARLARIGGVRVAVVEAEGPRLDAQMELMAGFPYKVPFASELARVLVRVLWPGQPKKGLITDLDNTLWGGIVGEVGVSEVSWHQDSHTQPHGLYQQMLARLSGAGVLLAVCSKNDPAVVEKAFERRDMLVKAQAFYPVEASWGAKSAAVGRILKTWNISEDAVVFVDDSPMELAEVQQAFPAMTCLEFRGKDAEKTRVLLEQLRDQFGKSRVAEEDLLRQSSIRAAAELRELGAEAASPEFLASLGGTVTVDWRREPGGGRALELINKTNQFNLNGRRISEGEWSRMMEAEGAVCAVVSYQDKFGSLGRVAVALGQDEGGALRLTHWVMSCRAFSRRIEHHTLAALYEQSRVDQIVFDFEATERNQPLVEFFSGLGLTAAGGLSRTEFQTRCGALPHQQMEAES